MMGNLYANTQYECDVNVNRYVSNVVKNRWLIQIAHKESDVYIDVSDLTKGRLVTISNSNAVCKCFVSANSEYVQYP